jgi:hypothetical protein
MAGTFALTDGVTALNTIFSEEADRIDKDVHGYLLHTSPWIDLSTRGEFESGAGYRLNSLIYDRSLPQFQANGASGAFEVLGVKFSEMSPSALASVSKATGVLAGSHVDSSGPTFEAARIDFTRKLREYSLKKATYFGPFLNLEDLRFTSQLEEQVSQMVEILGDSTKWVMENRFRDEYDRISDLVVACKTTGTLISTGNTGIPTGADDFLTLPSTATPDDIGDVTSLDMDANTAALLPTANISNRIMDKIQIRLRIAGANRNAWGMENGQAIHALVLSSEASYRLTTESGYRDDLRQNSGRVDELLQPLGVSKSFRGFYHIGDDLAPRFNLNTAGTGSVDFLERVQPYAFSSSVLIPNSAYETATYEAAYVLHKDVCKHLIPSPNVNAGSGVTFDPRDYTGKYDWLNIKDININPFGTIGRFGGTFATATKPIKVDYGVRIIFDRTSPTPAE